MIRKRCAVYTRKSTEEGLEQEFNSLDAQREACAAYILSQKQEGWMELLDRYDDGGFSGGTMDRPGLRQMLADVAAGRIDVIVVYKVDRLTRSLSDFAKMVDLFDEAGVSFLSVTQTSSHLSQTPDVGPTNFWTDRRQLFSRSRSGKDCAAVPSAVFFNLPGWRPT